MYKVMIADDQEAFRRLARVTLDRDADFQVIAEASSGLEAVRLADLVKPNLVLMDVEMPEMDGPAATKEMLKRHPGRQGSADEYVRRE